MFAVLTLAWPVFAAEEEADERGAVAPAEELAADPDEAEGAAPPVPEEGPLPEDENLAAPDLAPTPEGVEVIKVTAERREEFVQDVPISMVALDEEFLEVTDLTQFNRLQQFVPNLRISPVTDSRSTQIRIRGIGSIGNNAGVDPSVGVFIDGVFQGRSGMATQDFLDLERVEVLRGPQGTLYGKNTAAGAIAMHSRRPSYEMEAVGETIFSDYDGFQARGSVNVPIVDERFASRLSGYWVSRGGLDTNLFNGNAVGEDDRWGVKGRFLVDALDDLEILITGDYSQTGVRSCCYPDIITYAGPTFLGPAGATFQDLADARPAGDPYATLPVADPFDRIVAANRRTSDEVKVGGVAAEINAEIGSLQLTSLTAWRRYETDSSFDGDFSPYDAVVAGTTADLDQVSSELRLTSPGGELFDYVAGAYFYWQTQDTTDLNSVQSEYVESSAALRGANIFANCLPAPFPPDCPNTPIVNVGDNSHETWTVAGFADGTLNFAEKWSFTGGIRITYEYKSRVGSQTSNNGFVDAPPILGPDVFADQDRNVTNVSGRAIVRFFPVDDVMVYASFSTGFKSGGFNQLRTAAGVPSEFDDEDSLNGELGIRTEWLERRLLVNATGYYTDYGNFQAQSFDGGQISIRNAGGLRSVGFEADVTAVPLPGLLFGSLVGYNNATYTDFPNGECVIGSPIGCTQDLTGQRLDNAPLWTVAAFAQYDLPFDLPWFSAVLYTRGDYSYTSKLNLAQDLDPNLLQTATDILDLRTGFRAEDGRWDAQFWVRNVLDTSYNIVGFDVPVVSGYAGINGPQRQVGGTIRVRF